MKKSEIPQDNSALSGYTKELCYVKNEHGSYETGLSSGWDTKSVALDCAWDAIHDRIEDARKLVSQDLKSPIYYFMEQKLMDLDILSSYVGMMKFRVTRHMRPKVFKKLSTNVLAKYASVFGISIDELKEFKG